MSQVFVALCKLVFEPGGFNVRPSKGGINLQPIEARFFAVMGVILQDGGAHKSVWHSRDGSKVCLLCKNLFTIDSKLSDEDDTGMLCCGVINLTELKVYHRNSRGFKELEQSLGVTYHPKIWWAFQRSALQNAPAFELGLVSGHKATKAFPQTQL